MAVISPRRALVAAVSLCLLLGAATSIRTATFSPSQVRDHRHPTRRRFRVSLLMTPDPVPRKCVSDSSETDSALRFCEAQENLAEDKSRLGSTPPICRNRCSACNPCMPVQVTTAPAGLGRAARVTDADADAVAGFSRYSDYKPLGWKCGCDGRLYDP
jgi:hypothetical protein|uniref:Epidermal patterning factor-like protein n=1 Tax=Zea mays TaxID=4577 RepID=A0A804NXN3_MAIZE